ncbi:hypothetical protein J5288_08370 [Agrobacterium sp. S2/73]|uniref:hypothetical protein n=1 Tax=unclassified Agrobacterium TaxID=2632611 RepID=UPI001ADA7FE4|nr:MULTISPECIES: hypothetical protein [unclassified Agrobacterium]MBO9108715.1 hypothetical protein [Agrobacterium sp. S2/73]QXZ73526.1 hypothetical protein J5276_06140 [Agrobacterium sp. S7/73]
MRKSLLPLLLSCAAISGCQTTNASNVCAGWSKLTPTLETALKITTDDRQFANQVASHNAHGVKQKCW